MQILPFLDCHRGRGWVKGLGFRGIIPGVWGLESKLLKGAYIGEYIGSIIRIINGDTRSLECSSKIGKRA